MFARLRGMLGEFSQILALRLYAAAAGFALTLLLGRLLGPAEYGAYVFALSLLSFAVLFATLGFHHFTIRALPPLMVAEKQSEAMGVVAYASVVVVVLSLATAIVAGSNTELFSASGPMQNAVAIGCLLLVPRALGLLRTGILQGLGHPVAGQVPDRLIEPTLILAVVCLWALQGWALDARSVLLMTLAAIAASLILGAPSLRRAIIGIGARPSFGNLGGWTIGGVKSLLVFAAGTVLGATDVVVLGLMSTPEETGIYGVAIRFFFIMGLPFHAGAVYLSQRAAKLHALGDREALGQVVEKAAIRTILSAVALAVPSTILAFFVGQIFGAGFAPAGAVILVLVWTRVGLAFFGEPSALLAATQHVGRVSIFMGLAATLNIGLNIILVGPFGAMGAAIATVLSFCALTAALTLSVRSLLGIRVFYGRRLVGLGSRP
ncbi:Polysaccharide biosynthesis protein [Jannaschia aquimarina]|uniref:Polysaccharide biosynthesis protein n=2 Tax=Jannaschia aquimarina TaxID=935700 RepID=A0A0D1ELU1_9RHOB|nr:Polysaccharide biosynthesis protein [Jannaschia aquimarina]SNT08464.1 Membrane protein involved in the export of O-antigen and teichoic acid [Jannaschia aquimarina]